MRINRQSEVRGFITPHLNSLTLALPEYKHNNNRNVKLINRSTVDGLFCSIVAFIYILINGQNVAWMIWMILEIDNRCEERAWVSKTKITTTLNESIRVINNKRLSVSNLFSHTFPKNFPLRYDRFEFGSTIILGSSFGLASGFLCEVMVAWK